MASQTASRDPSAGGWVIEVVADSDTRWKWGATLAHRITPGGSAEVHGTLLEGRSCPTDRQLADVGVDATSLRRASLAEAAHRLADTHAPVVILACLGSGVQAMLHALARVWAGRAQRPVVVTGYVGLVYEKVVDGLLLRAGADVVLANSAADTERFRAIFRAAGLDPDTVVQTALPFLGGRPYDPAAAGRSRPYTLTYVTQPGVPGTRAQRCYALGEAVRYARQHRECHVVVKLRARAGERTTHVEPFPYDTLLPAHAVPTNLEFAHGSMSAVLDRTDLCVTVSSTAALEAMHRGIPTAILTDFGIREDLGNQLFLGCGALTTWRDLQAGAVPQVDAGWAARNGARDPQPYAPGAARIAALAGERAALPPLRATLQVEDAPGYLPQLLAGYGLDRRGAPLAGGAPGDAALGRRAVRAAARRAYGVGVRVLEPRIRRMAQL